MNVRKYAWALLFTVGFAGSCDLDSKMDAYLTDDMKDERYETLLSMGYKMYTRFQESHGFNAIDDNLFATVSDEAQYVSTSSMSQRGRITIPTISMRRDIRGSTMSMYFSITLWGIRINWP